MRQALELALEALQFALHVGFPESSESQIKKGEKAYQQHRAAITAIKEALAQPEEEKLHPVHIGVDVTKEGTAVTAFYRKPDAVMEMFYSQFHPLAQPEQEPVAKLDDLEQEIYENTRQFVSRDVMEWMLKRYYTTPPQRKEPEQEQEPVAFIDEQGTLRYYKPSDFNQCEYGGLVRLYKEKT
jgi:hypothetical protein